MNQSSKKFYALITDCADSNARARQELYTYALFPEASLTFTEVYTVPALAGNIIDLISVAEHAGASGYVLGNRAPREHIQNKYPNGAPFVYAHYRDILLVVTYSAQLHGILKHFLNIDAWYEPTPDMLADILATYAVDPTTQFRSLYYAPCVMHYVATHAHITGNVFESEELAPHHPWLVWHKDNFGNLKTFATRADYEAAPLSINGARVPFVERLKDAPDNHLVVIEGSSGFEGKKFLEVVVQGGSAATRLGKDIGDILE
ncbi:MAG: SAM-dependent chlorinase/fluorinase [Candidatus Pacebacteria bacterium]|nr:SAM-dependent chlorinase/fluorinase [Candidatus Paceibacterota bacterium]MCD8507837.1 SAM-dependent chlorinase/fluorinase [Candidatus Paceibacterota bacterium]MCD8527846.1 SAM-dependent chlorinase/fluorinase [Candidatus Paceibacterota bacterium]MCD8563516.1 SAM-dependent chlorinase/fluorinase [Candidatus Paceibacterota bacterium]